MSIYLDFGVELSEFHDTTDQLHDYVFHPKLLYPQKAFQFDGHDLLI